MTEKFVTLSIEHVESLMTAAAVVRGVYSAIDSHRQDVAVSRCRENVEDAIRNAAKLISAARKIKDPMEDEPATESELRILDSLTIDYEGPHIEIDPRDVETVSMLRKRLMVMGRMTGKIHWGDGTEEASVASDKIVWKILAKGHDELQRYESPHKRLG